MKAEELVAGRMEAAASTRGLRGSRSVLWPGGSLPHGNRGDGRSWRGERGGEEAVEGAGGGVAGNGGVDGEGKAFLGDGGDLFRVHLRTRRLPVEGGPESGGFAACEGGETAADGGGETVAWLFGRGWEEKEARDAKEGGVGGVVRGVADERGEGGDEGGGQKSLLLLHRSRSSYYNGLTSPDTQAPYLDTLQEHTRAEIPLFAVNSAKVRVF